VSLIGLGADSTAFSILNISAKCHQNPSL